MVHREVRRTSIRKVFVVGIIGYVFVIFLLAMLTTIEQGRYFSSRQLHSWSTNIQKELLGSFFTYENRYFSVPETETFAGVTISNMLFEFATRVNLQEPRTLLVRELPGLASFDGNIVVAGDGADITSMPIESAPPLDVLMEEREAIRKPLEIMGGADKQSSSSSQAPIAHIVHTHSRESFLPELESSENVAFHPEVNITLVGQRLGEKLKEKGVPTLVDTTDVEKKLQENNWEYHRSYDISREVVQEAMAENDQLQLFFDIHRDSQPRDITTVTINNETIARTMFVIGENNPNYEKNLEMAKDLHHRLQENYPGLSRAVITKGGHGSNGRYNQDLSEHSILIEIGGMENTLEEAFRAADILAEVISEQYFENQSEEGGKEE